MKFFGELGFLEANKTNENPATEPVANPAPELVEETKIGVDIMENLGGSLSAAREEEAPSVAEAPTASTASVDPHYAAAVRCYLRGELDEALENLQKVKADGKDLGEVYTAMAQIYLDRKEFAQAAEYYAELLKLEPENATAQFNAGLSLQATENYEAAQRAFQTAIQLDGELVDAYLGVAGCCLKLNDPPGAKAAYEAYLKVEPDAYTAVFGLGVAYHLSEDHEKAIECYRAALKQQPESEEVLANLTGVYMKQEEYEEAESAFRSLLKLAPESVAALEGLGYACFRQENLEAAREYYNKLVAASGESPEGWYNLGLVCQKLTRFEDAIQAYSHCLRLGHATTGVLLNFGTCCLETGKDSEAKAVYNKVLERDESSAAALYTRISTLVSVLLTIGWTRTPLFMRA